MLHQHVEVFWYGSALTNKYFKKEYVYTYITEKLICQGLMYFAVSETESSLKGT